MREMTQYEINIHDYLRVFRKRKSIIISITITLGALSLIFSYLKRPQPLYESIASVKIERSSTLAGLYLETISWNPEDNIATQVEVIKSFPIMEKVARRLGEIDSSLSYEQLLTDEKCVNSVLDLMSRINATQDGATNIVNIIVQSHSPIHAQQIANATAQIYVQESNQEKNERAINALEFINNQLHEVGQKLKDAEENVRLYQENQKVIELETKTDMISRELERARFDYSRLNQRRLEVERVIARLLQSPNVPIENFIELNHEDQSQTYINLSNQLAQLCVQRDNLLINYTKEHPDVILFEQRISELIKSISRELKGQRLSLLHREELETHTIRQLTAEYQQIPENSLELRRLQRKVQLNEELYTFLESKQQEALIKNAEKIRETSVVKPALPGDIINPPTPPITTLAIGLFIGLLIGAVVAFIYESLDTSFGTIEEVEKFMDVPVLGIIPHHDLRIIMEKIRKDMKARDIPDYVLQMNAMLVSHFAPKSSIAESYRALRTNVQHVTSAQQLKIILFTSSSMREGKSTSVANLAITIAQIGYKTLLIDADLRKPALYNIFGLQKTPGLSDILLGTVNWQDCVLTITDIMMGKLGIKDILRTPGIDNLHIVTSGSPQTNPSELLESSRMNKFLDDIRSSYDIILLDTAPVLLATDASILASKIDRVVLVYEIGRTARGALKRTKVQLENVNAKILGIVLNKLRAELNADYKDFRYDEYAHVEDIETRKNRQPAPRTSRNRTFKKLIKNGHWNN